MNCCDEYGECRQGRDCPVRRQALDQPRRLRHQLLLIGAFIASAIVSVTVLWWAWSLLVALVEVL
jgi:hypothetical protein